MLGRCQHTLYRSLLAALQPQQQCLQLEALAGLQIVRSKTWRSGGRPTAKQRYQQRHEWVVAKLTEKLNPSPAVASLGGTQLQSQSPPSPPTATTASTTSSTASPASETPSHADSSSSSSADPSPQQSSSSKSGSWMPSWLDGFLGNRPRPSSRGTVSPLQSTPATAASGDVASDVSTTGITTPAGGDEWAVWLSRKDLSLDDYQEYVLKQEYNANGPAPKPVRPRGLDNPYAKTYQEKFDAARVEHARNSTLYNIVSTLSPDAKALVHKHTAACIKDKAWINKLAQVAQVQPGMVLDLLRSYHKYRETIGLLAEYSQAGNKLPYISEGSAVRTLLDRLQKDKASRATEALLEQRDPDNCELLKWSSAWRNTGQGSMLRPCHRTGMPYAECCGALFGRPRKLQKKKRATRATAH